MKFDWTISIGNVITLVTFLPVAVAALVKVVRWTDRLDMLMGEYPPHRHLNSDPETDTTILYPRGMRPR